MNVLNRPLEWIKSPPSRGKRLMSTLIENPNPCLWAYRFKDGAPMSLENEALPSDLRADGGWIWAHFSLSDQRARSFLARVDGVPAEVLELLIGADSDLRILFSGAWAFGVIPDFEMEFDSKFVDVGRMRFAFDESRLITIRRHPLQVANDLHRQLEGGLQLDSPFAGFLAISRRYCEMSEDQLDSLAAKLDQIEDSVLAEQAELEQLELGPLRRELSRRHRQVSWLKTAYQRAPRRHGQASAHPIITSLPVLLQQTEDVEHEIAALQDRARLVHEELDTKLTTASNRSLHALTVMTALLMPATLLTGAFGMNLHGIFFADEPAGFAIVSALAALAVVMGYVLLKRFRILK